MNSSTDYSIVVKYLLNAKWTKSIASSGFSRIEALYGAEYIQKYVSIELWEEEDEEVEVEEL